jgi:hypothetical protein
MLFQPRIATAAGPWRAEYNDEQHEQLVRNVLKAKRVIARKSKLCTAEQKKHDPVTGLAIEPTIGFAAGRVFWYE